MTTMLEIGNMILFPFGIFTAVAAAVFCIICTLLLKRKQHVPCFLFLTLLLGLVFSRALYCAAHISNYAEDYGNLTYMLCFWDGGFSLYGLIPGLVVSALLMRKHMGLSAAELTDAGFTAMAPALSILYFAEKYTELGIGKAVEEGWFTRLFGFLFQTEHYGTVTEYRLRASLYACVFCLILTVILFSQVKKKNAQHSGDTSMLFLILFGAVSVLLESIRDDGHMLLIAFLRAGQIFSVVLFMTAFVFLCNRYRKAGTHGKILICVLLLTAALGGLVVLEFMIDGRLTLFPYDLGLFYGMMAICCGVFAGIPLYLLHICRKTETSGI